MSPQLHFVPYYSQCCIFLSNKQFSPISFCIDLPQSSKRFYKVFTALHGRSQPIMNEDRNSGLFPRKLNCTKQLPGEYPLSLFPFREHPWQFDICSHLPTPVSSKAHHQGLLLHIRWLVSLQPAPAQSQRSVPTSTLYYPRSGLHFFPPVLSEPATSLSNTSSLNHLKRKLPKHEINPACVNTQFSLN